MNRNDLVTWLAPYFEDTSRRREIVTAALRGSPELERVAWVEGAHPFTARLLDALDHATTLRLLETLRDHVEGGTEITAVMLRLSRDGLAPAPDRDRLFISYAHDDAAFVTRLARDLQAGGVSVWIDNIGLKPGTPDWEEAIRWAIQMSEGVVLVASPRSRRSRYVRDELALARIHGKPIYPVWAHGQLWIDCVPMGMGSSQYVDLRDDAYDGGLSALFTAVQNVAPGGPPARSPAPAPQHPPRNPYKGLREFRKIDRGDFFGRDALVESLVASLTEQTFLAIIGPSGSGKSSVVMAGLLPKLEDGALPGSETWHYLRPFTPAEHPLDNLRRVLSGALPHKSNAAIREDLHDPSMNGLAWLAEEIDAARVLLYIDQFEELFTLTSEEAERRQFIDLLTTAAASGGPLTILLTMRADFYDRPMGYPALGELIQDHSVSVLPMGLADLYEVIQGPASLPDVQLQFEDTLVSTLLHDVRSEGGALPLLQFTLDQLFQRRAGHQLTLDAYNAIGGVHGALAQHAEQVYEALPSERHRVLARALLLRLIEPGANEAESTRRRADRADLLLPNSEDNRIFQEVITTFTDARLLIAYEETLEVCHEALITHWTRLREWVTEAREDLRLGEAIRRDAREWAETRSADYLYRGERLGRAQQWSARNVTSLIETEFLKASAAANARLGDTSGLGPRYTDALYKITSTLSQTMVEPDQLLQNALKMVAEAVGADDGIIMLVDPATDGIEVRAMLRRADPHPAERVTALFLDRSGQPSPHSRQTLLDPQFSPRESAMAVLVEINEMPEGVIALLANRENAFNAEQLEFLAAVAGAIATSYNSADLYQLIRDQSERMGALLRQEQEAQALHTTILEVLADGIVALDADGVITLFNPAAERILDLPRESAVGRRLVDLAERYGGQVGFWAKFALQLSADRFEDPVVTSLPINGRDVRVQARPVTIGDAYLGLVIVFHDAGSVG